MFSVQLKLLEVNECNLMSYQYGNCAKKETVTQNDISSMSTESARRILFKDFGGKKAMKVLDRKEKMKINVDVVKDQLDKTLLGEFEIIRREIFNFKKLWSYYRAESNGDRERRRIRQGKREARSNFGRNGPKDEQRSN